MPCRGQGELDGSNPVSLCVHSWYHHECAYMFMMNSDKNPWGRPKNDVLSFGAGL